MRINLDPLISLVIMWLILSLVFPRWISNPIPIGIGIIKRIIRSIARATGRQILWHVYGKQQQRRGHGFALQHLLLVFNIIASVVVLYSVLFKPPTQLGNPNELLTALVIFWVWWYLQRKGHKSWRKFRSPKRKLPGRHR